VPNKGLSKKKKVGLAGHREEYPTQAAAQIQTEGKGLRERIRLPLAAKRPNEKERPHQSRKGKTPKELPSRHRKRTEGEGLDQPKKRQPHQTKEKKESSDEQVRGLTCLKLNGQ